MKKYTIRIFDGKYTTIYTTEAINKNTAIAKITDYHIALGGIVEKVTATEIGA